MLGLLDETKTADNMRRHSECVINLPDPENVAGSGKARAPHRQKSRAANAG
ncbi:MAG: hypothetical protein JO300_01230 [Silvibacterium sp.]|nr:hypothetical protein [Silvibacterium sp.]